MSAKRFWDGRQDAHVGRRRYNTRARAAKQPKAQHTRGVHAEGEKNEAFHRHTHTHTHVFRAFCQRSLCRCRAVVSPKPQQTLSFCGRVFLPLSLLQWVGRPSCRCREGVACDQGGVTGRRFFGKLKGVCLDLGPPEAYNYILRSVYRTIYEESIRWRLMMVDGLLFESKKGECMFYALFLLFTVCCSLLLSVASTWLHQPIV